MKKYDKRKLMSIYTLHDYYGSFCTLYKCINYKDAYKIITKYHPELSMEEFIDDLIKQANDYKVYRYSIALEGKNDFWIYENELFISGCYINDIAPNKVYLCSQDDYERVYTGKYDKKQYTPEAEKVIYYIDKCNPNASVQKLNKFYCIAIDLYSYKEPLDILNKLKESECLIDDEQYFLQLLNNFYQTYKKFGSLGRDLKQIKNNDCSNSIECTKSLNEQGRIGFMRIYETINGCIKLYTVFDHYRLAKILNKFFPQYSFDKVLDDVMDALNNFKVISKNLRRFNFKVYKVSKKDTYFTNDSYSYNFIIFDKHCPNANFAINYGCKVNLANNYYVPKDLNECISYVNPEFNAYKKLVDPIREKFFSYETFHSYQLIDELVLFSQRLVFNPQKFVNTWVHEAKLNADDKKWLTNIVNEFYGIVRIPSLYGFNRNEAKKLNIKPNYDIDYLIDSLIETIIRFEWFN